MDMPNISMPSTMPRRDRSKSRSPSSGLSSPSFGASVPSTTSSAPLVLQKHMQHERIRNYLYSAVTATFCFVLLRELGLIGQGQYGPPSPVVVTTVPVKSDEARTVATTPATSNSSNLRSSPAVATTSQSPPKVRPIMYTFFERISAQDKGTQMSDEADTALIDTWKAAWSSAGWEPRILTLNDAKKHPQYNDYVEELGNIPMLGIDGKGGNIVYNQLCFLRWMAMAAVGGGFMSDYDVFPLSRAPPTQDPPENGDFTVYSVVKGSKTAGIPCLMSGRSDEWTRMAYAIRKNGLEHSQNETMWSDMFALIDMRKDEAYNAHDAVVEGQDVLLTHGWKREDCRLTANKLAVHFSHEALVQGHTQPGETAENRPHVAMRFLTTWHDVCVPMEKQ